MKNALALALFVLSLNTLCTAQTQTAKNSPLTPLTMGTLH